MDIPKNMQYVVLALAWSAWCAVHSGMISMSVTNYLKRHLGSAFRFYRLFFNVVACVTLLPVVIYTHSIRSQPLFLWEGSLRIVQLTLIGVAVLLFVFGARHYSFLQFLGIYLIRKGTEDKVLTASGQLDTSGILGMIRHPWYLGAIIIIWAWHLDVSAIIVNSILTTYLIVGTVLEERKLVIEFGDKYREYQQNVSMLLPFKWVKTQLKK